MLERKEELTAAAEAASPESRPSWGTDAEFRSDLAFPKLCDEMLRRLGPYGQEGHFPKDTCLSGVAKHVHHMIRGASLESTMSQYLIDRIKRSPHITLHTDTEISKLEGDTALEFVTRINRTTGESVTMSVSSVFVMIGAEPNSGWIHGSAKLDAKGLSSPVEAVGSKLRRMQQAFRESTLSAT